MVSYVIALGRKATSGAVLARQLESQVGCLSLFLPAVVGLQRSSVTCTIHAGVCLPNIVHVIPPEVLCTRHLRGGLLHAQGLPAGPETRRFAEDLLARIPTSGANPVRSQYRQQEREAAAFVRANASFAMLSDDEDDADLAATMPAPTTAPLPKAAKKSLRKAKARASLPPSGSCCPYRKCFSCAASHNLDVYIMCSCRRPRRTARATTTAAG